MKLLSSEVDIMYSFFFLTLTRSMTFGSLEINEDNKKLVK